MVIAAALLACAANVAPVTLDAIARVESGGNPLAINVNHLVGPQPRAATTQEAIDIARWYIAAGYRVDLGIMQITDRNLPSLGYTVEDAFDPCRNLAGGAVILTSFYGAAVRRYGEGQAALMAALSAYNTGSFWAGVANGYVGRVTGIPSIQIQSAKPIPMLPPPTRRPDPYTADTVAYSTGGLHVEID